MSKKIALLIIFLVTASWLCLGADPFKRLTKPSPLDIIEMKKDRHILEKDQEAEAMPPLEPTGKISKSEIQQLTHKQYTDTLELPLSEWVTNIVENSFAPPRFNRNSQGYLEMWPNLDQPDNTFGFWSSPFFIIAKPDETHEANAVTAYVDFSYTSIAGGHHIPSVRIRLNRDDFQEAAVYIYDGNNLDSGGGSGVLRLKFDTNTLESDRSYMLSVDLVSFDSPADPNFKLTITRAYLVGIEFPAPPDFIIDGVWGETDYDAKAWINGYKIKISEDTYDVAYNDQIAAMVIIIDSYWNDYDIWVWVDDEVYWLNENDTFQVAVAGDFVAYLEQDGDVKVWNPFTDELLKIKDNGYRLSSAGDEAFLLWDQDDDLLVWLPESGLYEVDDDDIWYLCDTSTPPVPLE